MGGVAPPTHAIVLANGKTYTGRAMCKVVDSDPGALSGPTFFSSGIPNVLYRTLRDLGPVGHPATRVPEWQKYYNATQILKPLFQQTPFAFLIPKFYNENPAESFFPSPANTYLIAYIDRRLGPATGGHNVFVMHFKLPTTPKTYCGNPGPNDNGTVQVRYESLCVYTSPAIATNLQVFGRCLSDQTMLPDRSHMVTLVLSTRADRPKNAIPRCGVGWQELSAYGDNFGIRGKSKRLVDPGILPDGRLGAGPKPYLYAVVIRQQLPNANFKRAFGRHPHQRGDQAVPRSLLPRGCLYDSPAIRPHASLQRELAPSSTRGGREVIASAVALAQKVISEMNSNSPTSRDHSPAPAPRARSA